MNYLENVWYCVALGRDVTETPLRRVICEQPVVLDRTASGTIAALEDRCGHRQAPLSRGRVLGDEIQCMYHGYMFGTDGTCVHVPHQDAAPRTASVRSFATAERWGYVWLWRGEPAAADPATVPALPWTQDAGRRSVYFHFRAKANFQLMADNLLDVSHTDFLHRASIGSQSGMKTDAPKVDVTCTIDAGRVFCVRRLAGAYLGPVATKWAGSTLPVTRTNTQMWEAPNTIHSVLEFVNEETHRTIHMEHIMTPETATTCHYFMNWTRDFGVENAGYPTDDDVFAEQNSVVTTEDIPMVEAQQENLAAFGPVHDAPAKQDVFIINVHRVLAESYRRAGHVLPPELQRVGAGSAGLVRAN
jgi:phenylpropionate dioxygenase-like ring-hydroxylating dioxygenase large terminal subunit